MGRSEQVDLGTAIRQLDSVESASRTSYVELPARTRLETLPNGSIRIALPVRLSGILALVGTGRANASPLSEGPVG